MPRKSGVAEEVTSNEIPVGKTYKVIFRQNRPFELYIGRNMYRFEPYGEKVLGEEEVKHPDFISHRNYFTVIEGGN
jgi:hypothetical protein